MGGRSLIFYFGIQIFLTLAPVTIGRGENLIPESAFRVWLEPSFMHSPLRGPLPGAQKTVMGGGFQVDGELKPGAKTTLESLKLTWSEFEAKARRNASEELARLHPRYERDARKSIIYAALESDRPVVSCAVLAPGFLGLWKDSLGEKVLVVVPNQSTAFIFPRLASDYLSYAPMVLRANRESTYPVSLEVFEVSFTGWRCLGAYEEP